MDADGTPSKMGVVVGPGAELGVAVSAASRSMTGVAVSSSRSIGVVDGVSVGLAELVGLSAVFVGVSPAMSVGVVSVAVA